MKAARRTAAPLLVALTMFALAGPSKAQDSVLAVSSGQRVRVTAPAAGLDRTIAQVESLSTDRITLLTDARPSDRARPAAAGPGRITLPLDSVVSLEISRGTHRRAHKGSVTGGIALGALGLIWGASGGLNGTLYTCGGAISPDCGYGQLLGAAGGALGGALLGGLAGGVIGWLSPAETWEPVPTRHVRVTLLPLPSHRLGFGATLSF